MFFILFVSGFFEYNTLMRPLVQFTIKYITAFVCLQKGLKRYHFSSMQRYLMRFIYLLLLDTRFFFNDTSLIRLIHFYGEFNLQMQSNSNLLILN